MSKEKGVLVDGKVDKAMPNSLFRIVLDNGHEALAHISGKIRINGIKISQGDSVRVELSPYDLTKGRIVYLYKKKRDASEEEEKVTT